MKMIGNVVEKESKVVKQIRCNPIPSKGFPSLKPVKSTPTIPASTESSDEIIAEIESFISPRNIDFLRSEVGKLKIQEALSSLDQESSVLPEPPQSKSSQLMFSSEGKLIANESEAISLILQKWKESECYTSSYDPLFLQLATSLVQMFNDDLLSTSEVGFDVEDLYLMLNSTYQRKANLSLKILNTAFEMKQAVQSIEPYSAELPVELGIAFNPFHISSKLYIHLSAKFELLVSSALDYIASVVNEKQLRHLFIVGLECFCLPSFEESHISSILSLFLRHPRNDLTLSLEIMRCIRYMIFSQLDMRYASFFWNLPVDEFVFPPPNFNAFQSRTEITYEDNYKAFCQQVKVSRAHISQSPLDTFTNPIPTVFLQYPSLIFITSSSFREFLYETIQLSLHQSANRIAIEAASLSWSILSALISLADFPIVVEIFNELQGESKLQLDITMLSSSSMFPFYLYAKCELYRRIDDSYLISSDLTTEIDLYRSFLEADVVDTKSISLLLRLMKIVMLKNESMWEKYNISKLFDLSVTHNLNYLWSLSQNDFGCKFEIVSFVKSGLLTILKSNSRMESSGNEYFAFLDSFRSIISLQSETLSSHNLLLQLTLLEFCLTIFSVKSSCELQVHKDKFLDFRCRILLPNYEFIPDQVDFIHRYGHILDSFRSMARSFVCLPWNSIFQSSDSSFSRKILIVVQHILATELSCRINCDINKLQLPLEYCPCESLQSGILSWKYQRLMQISSLLSFFRMEHTFLESLRFMKSLPSTVQDIKLNFYRMLIHEFIKDNRFFDRTALLKRLFSKTELLDQNWLLTVIPLKGTMFLQWIFIILSNDENLQLVENDSVSFFVILQLLSTQHEAKWHSDGTPETLELQDKVLNLIYGKLIRIANSPIFYVEDRFLRRAAEDFTNSFSISKREGYLPFVNDIIEKCFNNDLNYEIHSLVLIMLLSCRTPPTVQQFAWRKLMFPSNCRYVNNLDVFKSASECLYLPEIQSDVSELELINSRREIIDVLRRIFSDYPYLSRLGLYYVYNFLFGDLPVAGSRIQFLSRVLHDSKENQGFSKWLIQGFNCLFQSKCSSPSSFEHFLSADFLSDISPGFLEIEVIWDTTSTTLKAFLNSIIDLQ